MTREEIIAMAREICDTDKVDAWHNGFWTLTQDELERFASLVAAAEREACAQECEASVIEWTEDSYNRGCRDAAAAIRARGNDD